MHPLVTGELLPCFAMWKRLHMVTEHLIKRLCCATTDIGYRCVVLLSAMQFAFMGLGDGVLLILLCVVPTCRWGCGV